MVVALAGLSLGKAFICVSEEIIKGCGRTGLLNWYTLTEVGVGLVLLPVFVGLFGLVGAALSVSITAIVVGIVVMALAKRCIPVSLSQLAGAILPPLPAAAIATVVLWLFEHHLAHSDTHPTLVAVALLALDALVFAAAYLLALGVFARSATTDLVGTVRRLVATAVRTRRDTRVDS